MDINVQYLRSDQIFSALSVLHRKSILSYEGVLAVPSVLVLLRMYALYNTTPM